MRDYYSCEDQFRTTLKHSCVDHFRTEGVVPNIKHLNHQFLKPLVTLGQGGVHLA